MKNFLFFILLSVVSSPVFSQNCEETYKSKIKNADEVEQCVLEASNLILSTTLDSKNETKLRAQQFVVLWMEKTKYEFKLGKGFSTLTDGSDKFELTAVYLACLAKAAINEKKDFNIPALKLYAEYLKNTNNKVKLTSKQKKFLKDVESGKFDDYLD